MHSIELGAKLTLITFCVNAHTDARTPFVDSSPVECARSRYPSCPGGFGKETG
jgi:hypothetical protein